MRSKKNKARGGSSIRFKNLTQKQLATAFHNQRVLEKKRKLEKILRTAINGFRPKKSERGSIVFINRSGKRGKGGRVGYALYINRAGKKISIRQYDRKAGKIESVPKARKIGSIDISRVRNKTAKKEFLQSHINPVSAGSLRKIRHSGKVMGKDKGGIETTGTRFAGKDSFDAIHTGSEAANTIGRELVKAFRTTKSNRDFLVTFGIHAKRGKEHFWFETQRRIVRRDKQELTLAEAKQFIGHEIYAFIAKELLANGLVLAGSARYVSRLKENRGKDREDWTKDGFEWGGAGAENVTIENVEWRFDQNIFKK